jgi:TatD DNase family protein
MLIDTHAHLIDKAYNKDLEDVLKRAAEAGVEAIINVGYTLSLARKAVVLAGAYGPLYATVGIHPHDAAGVPPNYLDMLQDLAKKPKVVALGEMGLDFYRNLSPPRIQEKVFREQLTLAKELRLPAVVHDRDAHQRVLQILKEEKAGDAGGVLHCFSGDLGMARECFDLGLYISVAGPVTYKKASILQEVVVACPRDRLLLETDCPYLTPHPYRGKRNEPAHVALVCRQIAALRAESPEEVAGYTTENAKRLFKL